MLVVRLVRIGYAVISFGDFVLLRFGILILCSYGFAGFAVCCVYVVGYCLLFGVRDCVCCFADSFVVLLIVVVVVFCCFYFGFGGLLSGLVVLWFGLVVCCFINSVGWLDSLCFIC